MKEYQFIIEILKKEVAPALGCTEPVAIALATAKAMEAIGGQPKKIKVTVSSNIFKNAMAVGIPGTDRVGIDIAAALGAFYGKSQRGLEVLAEVEGELEEAISFVEDNRVNVQLAPKNGVFIEAIVQTDMGTGRCIIEDYHTNIVLVEREDQSGKRTWRNKSETQDVNLDFTKLQKWLKSKKVAEIVDLVKGIPIDDIAFVLEGKEMNLKVAKAGLEHKAGMGVGYYTNKNQLSLESYAAALTAAACDVRMAGIKMPVMSSAGSGNHGLTAILPIVAVAEKLEKSDEELVRALALSHLITIFIKLFTGKLSPICGCAVAAGTGASAGIALLMGGDIQIIEGTIKNMAANITGMICDGGKIGCALKLYNATISACLSADLAMQGVVVPADNGIIHENIEQTILNMGELSYPGMEKTDQVILQIMLNNKIRGCA